MVVNMRLTTTFLRMPKLSQLVFSFLKVIFTKFVKNVIYTVMTVYQFQITRAIINLFMSFVKIFVYCHSS